MKNGNGSCLLSLICTLNLKTQILYLEAFKCQHVHDNDVLEEMIFCVHLRRWFLSICMLASNTSLLIARLRLRFLKGRIVERIGRGNVID